MARRQRHAFDLGRIPSGDDQPARIGIAADFIDHIGDLIDAAAVRRRPRAPLVAVDRTEIAVLVGPFIPDAHAVLVEIFDIGIAAQEPEQLVDDGFDVQLLGGEKGKATPKVEAHLMAEDRARADAGAVALFDALAEHAFHQVEILAHRALRFRPIRLALSLPSNERRTKPAQGIEVRGQMTSITTSPSPSTANTARWPGAIETVGMRLPVITIMPAWRSRPRSAT